MAKIKGTKKNDVLKGTEENDLIIGNTGDDRLFGRAGDDTLVGGAGDDKIVVDGGADTVKAGGGNDKVIIKNNASAEVTAGNGDDSVAIKASAMGSTIKLGAGDDTVTIAVSSQEGQTFNIDGGSGIDAVKFNGIQADHVITNEGGIYTVVDGNGNTYTISGEATLYFDGAVLSEQETINDAPVLSNALANQTANEDAAFSFEIPADAFSDPNGDALTYTATLENGDPLPDWLSFNAATRTFSGTPANGNVGSILVLVTASDGAATSTDIFSLNVANTNDIPEGEATAELAAGKEDAPYTVSEQSLLQGFSDIDGDDLSISGLTATNGATVIDNGDGTWTIKPAANFNGDVALSYNVVDGHGGSTPGATVVAFEAVNDAPVVANTVADQSATEGQAFNYQIATNAFTDVDNSALMYTATLENGDPLPSWLEFNASNGTFSGTPGDSDSGSLAIRVTASDGTSSASDVFSIKVNDVPPAPFPAPTVSGGVLQLTSAYDYDVTEAKEAGLIVVQVDGKTFTFNSDDIDSVKTVGSDSVDINTKGWVNRDIEGDVNFTNVTFVEADAATDKKFEASFEFGGFNVTGDVTVNGSEADFFKSAWDYIDDHYSYYDEGINSFGVDIAIKYALYLQAGGEPLTDVIVKYTADGADAGTTPDRVQSMHDNLLGNLDENSIADKFSEGVAGDVSSLHTPQDIFDRIIAAGLEDYLGDIGDITDGRGVYSGDEGAVNGATHNQVRVFDWEHGVDRPDYISFFKDGTVDAKALDGDEMYFGVGNLPENYVIEQHEGAGIETAMKVHFRTGDEMSPVLVDADGVATYIVPEGYQRDNVGSATGTNANRAAWSFDYSLVTGLNGAQTDLDDFDFVLKVDMDSSTGVDYMIFKLEGGNGVTPFVTRDAQGNIVGGLGEDGSAGDGSRNDIAQDSGNFGFDFFRDAVDGGDGYNFGKGEFDIELLAYKDGTDEVLSNVHIRVVVDSDQFSF